MAVLETTRTLRRHHEQCKQELIRQTMPCDGTSTASVRAWFEDIELAGAEVGAENQIEVAARTAAGSFRWELERYIASVLATNDNIKANFNVPWADVKAHLRTSFLIVDESSALHDKVEKTRQSAYEPEASFSRRFREVADATYPADGRNDDQNRAFARGLRSDELARKRWTLPRWRRPSPHWRAITPKRTHMCVWVGIRFGVNVLGTSVLWYSSTGCAVLVGTRYSYF